MSRCVCSALLSPDVWACRAGCSVPFSLFFGTLFLVTLSCYTLEFVREGTADGQKPERYCFDPAVGQCAPASRVSETVCDFFTELCCVKSLLHSADEHPGALNTCGWGRRYVLARTVNDFHVT